MVSAVLIVAFVIKEGSTMTVLTVSKKFAEMLDGEVAKYRSGKLWYRHRKDLYDTLLSCLKIELFIQSGGALIEMKEVRRLLDEEIAKRGGVD